MDENILEVRHLHTDFVTDEKTVQAVNDVSFEIKRGETFGLIGESGCGKSVTCRSLMRLLKEPGQITGGEILYKGKNVLEFHKKELQAFRGREIGMIFQDAGASLSPIRTIGAQIRESMAVHKKITKAEAKRQALQLFEKIGLEDGERIWRSYPFELSGGMKQRVGIALAMLMEPPVLLADEPTSALDVAVQKQVAEEMLHLREVFGTAIVLVTHDIGVVSAMADTVLVLKDGCVAEYGTAEQVLKKPRREYTKNLLAAVPRLWRK